MRFLTGVLASIIVSFMVGFFPSMVKAEQNSCDPDSESYDASACFEHVRALEASEKSAKRDLVRARHGTTVVESRLKAAEARHTSTSNDLRWDIVSGAMTIRSLETTVKILSEEKETAWGYVDVVSKVLAAAIGLAILGGSIGFYFLRKSVSDYDRYVVKVRDAKIRELENTLRVEADARIMAQGDAAALRLELFHKKDVAALRLELLHKKEDLARVRQNYANLLKYVRQEMSRFVAIRETLYRTLSILQANGSRLEQLSDPVRPNATV